MAVWLCCVLGVVILNVSLWIVGFVLVFTLPALWDMWTHAKAGLHLSDQTLAWYTGRAKADVALVEIDHIEFVTRLDFTVRVVVVLKTGGKLRLPQESTPPHKPLQDACESLNLRTERHHFATL